MKEAKRRPCKGNSREPQRLRKRRVIEPDWYRYCMVRRATARVSLGEKTSLRKCIRPLVEMSSPGHDELRAYLSL